MSQEDKIKEAEDMNFENFKLSVKSGIEKIRSMSARCRIKASENDDPEWEALAEAYGDSVKIMIEATNGLLR